MTEIRKTILSCNEVIKTKRLTAALSYQIDVMVILVCVSLNSLILFSSSPLDHRCLLQFLRA